MRADKLLEVINEMLRLDKDVRIETLFDCITFVFSQEIDICLGTCKIYKDKYGLEVDSRCCLNNYVESFSLNFAQSV